MRYRPLIAMAAMAALALGATACADDSSTSNGNTPGASTGEIKSGLKVAFLRGDAAKGANHIMLKLPGGFSAPLHHHSADHYVSVITGTLVLTVDGKETKLPPGSYFAFTGKKQHLTKCDAGADCTLFIDNRGKWDVVPEGGKAAPAKKK